MPFSVNTSVCTVQMACGRSETPKLTLPGAEFKVEPHTH